MIAYDTNILIYAFEGTSDWTAAAQAVVEEGERAGAVLSILVWQELMTGAVLTTKGVESMVAKALDDFSATKFVAVTPKICERSVGLTKKYGKRVYGYDAIHLATAIEHGASIFITNDKALLSLKMDELSIRGL